MKTLIEIINTDNEPNILQYANWDKTKKQKEDAENPIQQSRHKIKKQNTMKNQELINRLTELAKPKNLDERKEKRDLSSMAYCEINEITDVVYVSVSFNDDDVWYEYEVDFVNVVEHFYDVSGGQALIEYDFEGNLTQWIPIEDVEIDGYDVLEYMIDNALLKTYSAITNSENF